MTYGLNRSQSWVTIAEDLEHLGGDWVDDPADAIVRRGSVILRRFLAEGVLQHAWKYFGFEREPTIIAPNLDAVLGQNRTRVEIALAGGAYVRQTRISGTVLSKASCPHVNPGAPHNACDYPFRLREFSESTAVVIHGESIKRRELVKYFANFVGGANLHLSSRVRRNQQSLVRRTRRWESQINIHSRDGLYFELLSIGQALGTSDDCKRLVQAIKAGRNKIV